MFPKNGGPFSASLQAPFLGKHQICVELAMPWREHKESLRLGASFQFQRQGGGLFWDPPGGRRWGSGKGSSSLDACASDRHEPLLWEHGQDSVSPLDFRLLIL